MSGRSRHVRNWDIWTLPRRLIVLLISVEVITGAVVGASVAAANWGAFAGSLPTTVGLLAASVLYIELALRLERARRQATGGVAHIDMTGVWTFSAALLLPGVGASIVILGLYAYIYVRIDRFTKVPPFRPLYAVATIIMAAYGSTLTLGLASPGHLDGLDRSPLGALALVASGLIYTLINMTLIVTAQVLKTGQSARKVVFGGGGDLLVEISTLFLGALLALGVNGVGLYVIAFAIAPLLLLHKAVLARHLERSDRTDAQTGLLNAAGWQAAAQRELRRFRGSSAAGVLLLDIDHLRSLNEVNGRAGGDQVLSAVAATILEEASGGIVGRIGVGFAVLLPAPRRRMTAADLGQVAEQLRARVEAIRIELPTPDGPRTLTGVTVSIGGVVYPQHARRLESLTNLAGQLMYLAKADGRNAVRIKASDHDLAGADPVEPPPPRAPRRDRHDW